MNPRRRALSGIEKMQTFTYVTASVRVAALGRVAVGRVTGLVTISTAGQIMQDEARWIGGQQLAQIIDCSAAGVAIAANDLLATAQRKLDGGGPPTVFIVSRDQLPLFDRYTDLALSCGVLKAAFSSERDAQEWAQMAAKVHQYRIDRAMRRQLTPSDSQTAYLV